MKVFFVNRRLAFGSAIKTSSHVEILEAEGITHVMNLRRSNNRHIRRFDAIWLPFKDNGKRRPKRFYRRALKFYRKARKEPRSKVLVMCHYGMRRSPSMTYFLLRASGFSTHRATSSIIKARAQAKLVRAYRESGEKYLRRMKRWHNI